MKNSTKNNIIEISNLNKWFGEFQALNNINLKVKEGEIIRTIDGETVVKEEIEYTR